MVLLFIKVNLLKANIRISDADIEVLCSVYEGEQYIRKTKFQCTNDFYYLKKNTAYSEQRK